MKTAQDILIGETLRQTREEHGLTQGALAQALTTTQSHVSKLERGERSLRFHEVFAYAFALGMSPEELIDQLVEVIMRKW